MDKVYLQNQLVFAQFEWKQSFHCGIWKADVIVTVNYDSEGLRLILETADGIELVGEAKDGAECLELVKEFNPDVILMDLQMPHMDGITAIEHLRKNYPEIAIVILTTYNEDDLMIRGLQSGARGYLLKDSSQRFLCAYLRLALR